MAFYGADHVYISSARYAAVAAWAAATVYAAGDLVRQLATPTVNNERVFVCVVGGTSGGSEPTWTITRGASTTDNTVTWRECTGHAAMNGDLASAPLWASDFRNTNITLGHTATNPGMTHAFICTTSGNSNNVSEPSWDTTTGNTTTDGTATWTCVGTPGAWAAPHARMAAATDNNWGGFPTNKFWVGSDHAETQASQLTWGARGDSGARAATTPSSTNGPIDVICVDVNGSLPPVEADLATTASMTTTGSNHLIVQGFLRWVYGINFFAATTGSNNCILNNQNSQDGHFQGCKFNLPSTGNSQLQLGGGTNAGRLILNDCTVKFGGTGQGIAIYCMSFSNNLTIDPTGSIPNFLFTGNTGGARATVRDSDLSAATGVIAQLNNAGQLEFIDCKLDASIKFGVLDGVPSGEYLRLNGPVADAGCRAMYTRCSGAAAPYHLYYGDYTGHIVATTEVRRTGGASDGVNAYGWWARTTAKALPGGQFFECPAIAVYNETTGSNITITMYGVSFGATFPTNADISMRCDYQGASGNTLGSIAHNGLNNPLDTPVNHTVDSTSVWSAGLTARGNTTAYVVGDIIGVSSNADRMFVCTTAGTSNGSLPGGYATMVDGDTITDGSAVFRAGWRFSMAVSITSPQVQQPGPLYVQAILSTGLTTFGLDPKVVLS